MEHKNMNGFTMCEILFTKGNLAGITSFQPVVNDLAIVGQTVNYSIRGAYRVQGVQVGRGK